MDFTAIDFETANSFRGSPCAVGLVRVRDGAVVDQQRWLIRPPEAVDHFDAFNTSLHGISAADVAGAPRWASILPDIVNYIGGDLLVAHNAGFDIGVMRSACAVDGLDWPATRFLCTLVLSRHALSLPSYRLPFVAEAVGVDVVDHHDPLADALAVVGIARALASAADAPDLETLARGHGVAVGTMGAGRYVGSVSLASGSHNAELVRADVNPDADPDGYLYGRVVVFTGALMSMSRQIAWDECVRVGAIPEKTTTKRTNVLVVGDINPAVLRPGADLTKKAQDALTLRAKGQDIELMAEDDFLRCLDPAGQ
jgi:DNA polymerase-3 subunit epsilon